MIRCPTYNRFNETQLQKEAQERNNMATSLDRWRWGRVGTAVLHSVVGSSCCDCDTGRSYYWSEASVKGIPYPGN